MRWTAITVLMCLTATVHADVKVTPVKIIETRAQELIKSDAQAPFWETDKLMVTVRVSGPEIKGAASYGKLKLTRVLDDAETDLIPKTESIFGAESRFIRVHEMIEPEERTQQESFEAEIELVSTARKATKIAQLTGEMTVLAGGETKTFDIVDPLSKRGRPLTDPTVTSANLTASIPTEKEMENAFTFGDGQNISLKITGDLDAVREVDVVDAQGQSISQGQSASTEDKTRTHTLFLSSKPTAQTIVRITYVVGQKSVNVPFDLKDIPLP